MNKYSLLLMTALFFHSLSSFALDITYNLNFDPTPANVAKLDSFLLGALADGKNTGIKVDSKDTGNKLKVTVHCVREEVCLERYNKFLERLEHAGVQWNSNVTSGTASGARATGAKP